MRPTVRARQRRPRFAGGGRYRGRRRLSWRYGRFRAGRCRRSCNSRDRWERLSGFRQGSSGRFVGGTPRRWFRRGRRGRARFRCRRRWRAGGYRGDRCGGGGSRGRRLSRRRRRGSSSRRQRRAGNLPAIGAGGGTRSDRRGRLRQDRARWGGGSGGLRVGRDRRLGRDRRWERRRQKRGDAGTRPACTGSAGGDDIAGRFRALSPFASLGPIASRPASPLPLAALGPLAA